MATAMRKPTNYWLTYLQPGTLVELVALRVSYSLAEDHSTATACCPELGITAEGQRALAEVTEAVQGVVTLIYGPLRQGVITQAPNGEERGSTTGVLSPTDYQRRAAGHSGQPLYSTL